MEQCYIYLRTHEVRAWVMFSNKKKAIAYMLSLLQWIQARIWSKIFCVKGSIIYKELWCKEGKSQLPWDAFRNRDIAFYSTHNSIALQNIFTVQDVSLYMYDVKVDFFNKVFGSYSKISLLSSLKKICYCWMHVSVHKECHEEQILLPIPLPLSVASLEFN